MVVLRANGCSGRGGNCVSCYPDKGLIIVAVVWWWSLLW